MLNSLQMVPLCVASLLTKTPQNDMLTSGVPPVEPESGKLNLESSHFAKMRGYFEK